MSNFTDRYISLLQDAQKKIKEQLNHLKLDKYSLANPDEIDLEKLGELPFFSKVSKHGFYIEYGIHTIRKVDELILFDGIEKGEESEEDSIELGEMQELYSLCTIADILSNQ